MRKLEGFYKGTPVYSDPEVPPGQVFFMGERIMANVDDSTYLAQFAHLYNTSWTGKYKRHACLMNGYWCWRNLLEHPLDVIKFVKRKWNQLK